MLSNAVPQRSVDQSTAISQHELPDTERGRGRLVVTLEQRFERLPDGAIWGPATYDAGFWARYLNVFAHVTVVARVTPVSSPTKQFARCDGEKIAFQAIPYYVGPWQFLRARNAVRRAAVASIETNASVIARIPSPIGSYVVSHLRRIGKPYAVEVVGDPYDVMSPQAFHHPLRPVFRWYLTRQQRSACLGASGAAYVTERTLQARYPCRGYSVGVSDVHLAPLREQTKPVFTAQYSSVSLSEYVESPRIHEAQPLTHVRIISVGTMSQRYKGIDVLIDAVNRCRTRGLNVELVVVGDGHYRAELEAQASALGIREQVRFTGYLSRPQVVSEFDAADLFVLPSRCEGLPRALIEAMARGLPCVASRVGGIPELLASEDLVPPGDVETLASTINRVVADGHRRTEMSRRNLARAYDYREDILEARRQAFYREVRAATEEWLTHRASA